MGIEWRDVTTLCYDLTGWLPWCKSREKHYSFGIMYTIFRTNILSCYPVDVKSLRRRVVHIISAMALGRGRVAIPILDRLYPWESPEYIFYRRPSGLLDSSRHEGVKNNLHPSEARDRTWAVQPIDKQFLIWAAWPTKNVLYVRFLYTSVFQNNGMRFNIF